MSTKELVKINYKSKEVLNKTKKLLKITDEILTKKQDSEWTNILLKWFSENIIQERTNYPKNEKELLEITKLSLRWNRLNMIPKELFNLVKIDILELNNNAIEILPKELGKLVNLKELNLNINSLRTLPKEIIEVKQLKVLNLKNNKYLELSTEQITWIEELKKNGCNVIYDKYKFKLGE